MATTPMGLMQIVGKELKEGDILVEHGTSGGSRYYEVLDVNALWKPEGLGDKLMRLKESPGVKLRELYPSLGPSSRPFIVRKDGENWDFDDVIKAEGRIDRPSLKER